MTEILSTARVPGAPWRQKADTLDRILRDLDAWTLDPALEECGGIVDRTPEWLPNTPQRYMGCAHVLGNFLGYSGRFEVVTDDELVLARLEAAVSRNMATSAYRTARREYDAEREERRRELLEATHGK